MLELVGATDLLPVNGSPFHSEVKETHCTDDVRLARTAGLQQSTMNRDVPGRMGLTDRRPTPGRWSTGVRPEKRGLTDSQNVSQVITRSRYSGDT